MVFHVRKDNDMTVFGIRRSLCAALSGAVLILSGCGGGGGSADVPAQAAGTVHGTVVASSTGADLAGVAVVVAGHSTVTAADGSYTLTAVPAGDGQVVTYSLAGYAKGVVPVSVTSGAVAQASARLTPVSASQTVDATSGGVIGVAGSPAQVTLPAGGLVSASGAAATGPVRVELTVIDPASDPANMPGNYTAQTAGGGTAQIESFGALQVTLTDASGASLNLASGKTATLRIPLSSRSAVPPATVPLFYLNETTGLWVQEGSASLTGTAPDQYYEGTVGHFSYWNADQITETIRVFGCVQDAAARRVASALVHTSGSDYSGIDLDWSNANGDFVVRMRKDSIASLMAELGPRSAASVRVGPSSTDITLGACLVMRDVVALPQILVPPASRTLPAGSSMPLLVEASGAGTLRYQWQRNGIDIPGANAARYVVAVVSVEDNGARYAVVVSNAGGSVTSAAAVLTVQASLPPLVITGQPQPASVHAGQQASFSASTSGSDSLPAASYQWQRNGVDIAGATSLIYTTPVTALADSGASFSVRISRGTDVLTSNPAVLTVTQPTGASGYYLVAPAGPAVSSSVTYANGVQTFQSQAILAVNTANPAGVVTLAPAGQAAYMMFTGVIEASVSAGVISQARSRFAVYLQGGRLVKVDQVVTNGGLPTATLLSSLTSPELCGDSGYPMTDSSDSGFSPTNPLRSWIFFKAPGTDGQCGTADDNYRAVRMDMAPTEAASSVAEPQTGLLTADLALAGLVVRNGNQMQLLDANLANPVNLFTINPVGFRNLGLSFGSAASGFWLFVDGGKLWGVNLASPATRVALTTMTSSESDVEVVSDGAAAYIAISSSTGSRLLRVDRGLVATPLATLTPRVFQLEQTPTRLVALGLGTPWTVQSVPKTGGATTLLHTLTSLEMWSQMLTAGENVYLGLYQAGGTGSVSTLVVGADGSNPVLLANTAVKQGIAPASWSLGDFGAEPVYQAVVLADGVTRYLNDAGATLRVVDGATRTTLATYGSLPAQPDVYFGTVAGAFQYGQSGLFASVSIDTGLAGDLFYYKSDAPGLVRVTNFGTPVAVPAAGVLSLSATRRSAAQAAAAYRAGVLGR